MSKYQVTVHHVPEKNIPVSDCLSRHSVSETYPDVVKVLDLHVYTVKKQSFVTDQRLEKLRAETKTDKQMSLLKRTILQDWPETRSNGVQSILEFLNHRDESSVEDGHIFVGHTLLIPRSMSSDSIEKVHLARLGISKTLLQAKDSLFWPGMSKQITEYVTKYHTCVVHRDANTSMTLIPTEFPDRPFQKDIHRLIPFDCGKYRLYRLL